ncbi:MAG: class I tRNA ligase family protein [Thermoplasmata archaeon]
MGISISGEIFLALPYDKNRKYESLISALYSDVYRLYLITTENAENYESFPSELAFLSLKPRSLILPADMSLKTYQKKEIGEPSDFEKNIDEIIPKINVYSADLNQSLKALNDAFLKFWNMNAIYLDKRPVLWCDNCHTTLTKAETTVQDRIKKKIYIKLKIDKDVYFICRDIDDIIRNLRGINVNPHETFTIMAFGTEKWIVPERIEDDVKNKIGIFAVNVSKSSGRIVLSYFKEVPALSLEKIASGPLAPAKNNAHFELMKNIDYHNYKPEFEVIYTEQVKLKTRHCIYCNEPVSMQELDAIYIKPTMINFATIPTNILKNFNFSNLLISSNLKTVPKMPLLMCHNCGKVEIGEIEKKCSCGGVLTLNFGYEPHFLTLGVYYLLSSTKNVGLLYKSDIEERASLFMAFSHLRTQYFSKVKIVPDTNQKIEDYLAQYDPSTFRLGVLLNEKLALNDSIFKRARKFIKRIKNIVNYSKIYGVRESYDTDRWILSKLEKTKQEYVKNMDLLNYKRAFEALEKFVKYYFSKIYIKLIRFQPLPKDLIYGIFVLSYPFIPSIVDSLKLSYGFEKLNLNMGEFEIDEELETQMQNFLDIINNVMSIRKKYNISLKKPLKRLVLIGKDEDFIFINTNISKLSIMINVNRINTYPQWREIALKVEANREAIGQTYRQWQSKISDLLSSRDPLKVKEEIDRGSYELGIEGQTISITKNMVNFVQRVPDGYVEFDTPYGKGYLYTLQDEQTKKMHVLNKIIRSIKIMRKDINMDYDDYVDISISDILDVKDIINTNKEYFSSKLLYKKLDFDREVSGSYIVSWKILEYNIDIGITPLFRSNVLKAFEQLPGINQDLAQKLFDSDITSIYELMRQTIESLMQKVQIDENVAKSIIEYLKNKEKFEVIIKSNKYLCSLCGTELELNEEYCPRCLAPQNWQKIRLS